MGSEEEQKQALHDYLNTSFQSMKHIKRKRIMKIVFLLFIVLLVIFIVFNNPFTFIYVAKKDLRYYDIRLNNHKLSVSEEIQDTTIIPNFIVIPNGNSGTFSIQNSSTIGKQPYVLSLKSYTCFIPNKNKRIKTSCSKDIANKYENKDTSYIRMQILKYDYDPKYEYGVDNNGLFRSYLVSENSWYSRPFEEYTIVYDGKFIEDITYYVTDANVYVIKVEASYKFTKATLSFGLINDGENVHTL